MRKNPFNFMAKITWILWLVLFMQYVMFVCNLKNIRFYSSLANIYIY